MKLTTLYENTQQYHPISTEHYNDLDALRSKLNMSLFSRNVRVYLGDNILTVVITGTEYDFPLMYDNNGIIKPPSPPIEERIWDILTSYEDGALFFYNLVAEPHLRRKAVETLNKHIKSTNPMSVCSRLARDPGIAQLPTNLAVIMLKMITDLNVTSRSPRLDIINSLDDLEDKFTNKELNILLKSKLSPDNPYEGVTVAYDLAKFPEAQHARSLDPTKIMAIYSCIRMQNQRYVQLDDKQAMKWAIQNQDMDPHLLRDTIYMAFDAGVAANYRGGTRGILDQHDELARQAQAKYPQNKEVSNFNLDVIKNKKSGKLELKYLQSTRDLHDEAKTMTHCVASYNDRAQKNYSIYRILYDGRHVGTLSLYANNDKMITPQNATLHQAYGHRNSLLPAEVMQELMQLLRANKISIK